MVIEPASGAIGGRIGVVDGGDTAMGWGGVRWPSTKRTF